MKDEEPKLERMQLDRVTGTYPNNIDLYFYINKMVDYINKKEERLQKIEKQKSKSFFERIIKNKTLFYIMSIVTFILSMLGFHVIYEMTDFLLDSWIYIFVNVFIILIGGISVGMFFGVVVAPYLDRISK